MTVRHVPEHLSGMSPGFTTSRAIQWRDVDRAKKDSFRPADAGLLDYPHEAGNDGVEGSGFQFELGARCNQSSPK